MTHMKSCAKSKGVTPDRLVQLMRESKKTSSAVMDSAASSGVQESSSSSRTEGEGEGERREPLQTRRSKRLADQSGKGWKQGKGLEATSVLSREDEDFTMPPPVGRPAAAGRRGRKRKRDNLQDKLVP